MTAPGIVSRLQVALGVGFLLIFVGFSLWARFDVPYRDDWDWIRSVLTGQGGMAGLLQPHNEHVIPLARLLMSAQLALGGLQGHLIQYVALVSQLAIIWVFWREVGRRWPDQPAWRGTVGGLVLVCLSLTQQLQSIVFAAAVLFPLVQLWTTLAIVALLVATDAQECTRKHRTVWWVLSIVCAGAAAASTTSGLVVPVILGGLAWLRGASWKVVAAWAGATVVLLIGYVLWVGLGQSTAGSGLVEPWAPPSARGLVAYALGVLSLGAPYVHTGGAVLLGGFVLAGILGATWLALRHPDRLTRLDVFALGQMAFGLASTIMVTPGRAQFGVIQAAQSRYATFVVCLLAALVMFWASRLSAGPTRPWTPRVRQRVAAALLVFTGLLLVPNVYTGLLWQAKAENLNLAYLSLRSGVADPAWVTTLHPLIVVIDEVRTAADDRGMRMVDPSLGSPGPTLPSAMCSGVGQLTRSSRDLGMRFTGAWPPALTRGVILDRANVIVGLAQPLPWVREPEPTATEVHTGVMRGLREWVRRDDGDVSWGGFAQAGAGAPYHWVGGDDTRGWTCVAPLTLTSTVRATLDRVDVAPGNVLHAAGWAFACGEDVTSYALVVDAQPVDPRDVEVVARIPRPDVQAAFAATCAPDGFTGVQVRARLAGLSAGTYTVALRVVSTSGATAESAPLTFVLPAGTAR